MSLHLRTVIASLPILLSAIGCIHNDEAADPEPPPVEVRQSPGADAKALARAVQILGAIPPGEDLIPVGEVECGIFPELGGHPWDNARECRADLRQQARRQGASVVVLATQQVGIAKCWGCVYFYGTAYRRADAQPKATAPRGEITPDAGASP